MNRAARRKYMKRVKSCQTYTCERCDNTIMIFEMKNGSSDVLMSKSDEPELMCSECRELYMEAVKARNGVE